MGRTVLIAEDDKSVARLLQDLLEGEGYQVLVESDGEWALRAFQQKPVDLVVLDVLLPKLVGFELVEQIRRTERGQTVPIIMLSGVYRAAAHQQKMSERFGVRAYFDKPVDLDRFMDAVSTALPLEGRKPEPTEVQRALHRNTQRISIADFGEPSGADLEALMRAPNLPVPRRGDLEELPFARLLGQLYAAKASGALMLRKGAVKKIVYLRQGVPVFVKSNVLAECLGHVMVKERLISQAQCDKSVEKLKAEKKPQGQILVQMGAISPHNLEFGLERQLELKLYDLFSWLEGKYLFNDKDEHKGAAIALSLSPAEIVFEGVRRTMSVERVNKELARIADRIPIASNDPTFRYQALELNPRAERLLDAIDGRRRMSELLAAELMPAAHASVLLYALVSTSLIRLLDAPAVMAGPIPLDEDDLEALDPAIDEPGLVVVGATREPRPSQDPAPVPAARALASAEEDDEDEAEILASIPASPAAVDVDLGSVEAPLPIARPSRPAPPSPPSPPRAESDAEGDGLSTQVRESVRARLEASLTARLATRSAVGSEPAPAASARASARAPKLDLERDAQRRIEELTAEKARLEPLDPYARLELDASATGEEIEAAFEARSRPHHPDRILTAASPRALRVLAEEVHLLWVRARDALLHPEQRKALDRRRSPDRAQAAAIVAEDAFTRGLAELDRGEVMAAYDAFDRATQLAEHEGLYLAHLAWASFMLGEGDGEVITRALAELDQAIEKSPRAEEPHVFAGLIHEKRGDKEEAARCFRRALLANPDSVRALRALRALAPQPDKKAGFFGLFGG